MVSLGEGCANLIDALRDRDPDRADELLPQVAAAARQAGADEVVDAFGSWIWNEGRPADIPRLGGERVVVLDPPPYLRSWTAGRAYPLMRPSVDVQRVLAAGEAERWLALVKPSRP